MARALIAQPRRASRATRTGALAGPSVRSSHPQENRSGSKKLVPQPRQLSGQPEVSVSCGCRRAMRRLRGGRKNKRSIRTPNVQYARRAAIHSQPHGSPPSWKKDGSRDPGPLICLKKPMNIPADPSITALPVHTGRAVEPQSQTNVVFAALRTVAPLKQA